jgi:hypothetical protein
MSGTAPYYTQALPLPGRCFRLLSGGEGGGSTHCPKPPVLAGPLPHPQRPPPPGRGVRGSPVPVATAQAESGKS